MTEEPPLQLGEKADHLFACWYQAGTPEGKAAFETNLAAGRPQTLAAIGQTAQEVDIELTAAP